MATSFDIAVLGGDGIGPEVCDQAVRLIEEIAPRLDQVEFNLSHHSVGVGEYQRSGNALPDATFEACRSADAVLLGAMGLPNVRYPNGKEIAPQLDLRERLQLYGGVRPIRLFNAADTPLKGYDVGDIDFVLLRESTEGLFSGRDSVADLDADESTNLMRISRRATDRLCRMAFEIARKRGGDKRVVLFDKANVLSSMVYMRHIFDVVAAEYPECQAVPGYVDASALFMVQRPETFDVVVTENMFGDILSDLAAGLVGGMGMAPSGDIGDDAAVFQPSHGSAPDIAGKGIANPVAMILSAAMMLDWFGHRETRRAAEAIRLAVEAVFADPESRTRDMGGKMSTAEMTDAISSELSTKLAAAGAT